MYSILATHNKTSVGVNFYLADTYDEILSIKARPGSKAYVIEDEKTYILKHSGEWVEYYSSIKKYVDEKIGQINPDIVEELKALIEDLESGAIDEKIAEHVAEQLATEETQAQLVSMIKEGSDLVTVDKLETYNYITEEELSTIILSGGTAKKI